VTLGLAERARALDPWWFQFEVDGERFGGEVPRDTARTATFFEWVEKLQLPVRTILELGSHEGNHTLQLASHPGVEKVVGLEGRSDNIARANFVKEAVGVPSIEFHQQNLEHFNPADWPEFDAVFCSGLLYHLPNPWELLTKISRLVRHCILVDTLYSEWPKDLTDRTAGQWCNEPTGTLAGFSKRSFLLSFKSIAMLMMEQGLVLHHVTDYGQPRGKHYRILIFAEKTGTVRWKHWRSKAQSTAEDIPEEGGEDAAQTALR
jgi:SAM-dependent methyltransferase